MDMPSAIRSIRWMTKKGVGGRGGESVAEREFKMSTRTEAFILIFLQLSGKKGRWDFFFLSSILLRFGIPVPSFIPTGWVSFFFLPSGWIT